jgi:hypothetical protein
MVPALPRGQQAAPQSPPPAGLAAPTAGDKEPGAACSGGVGVRKTGNAMVLRRAMTEDCGGGAKI